MAKKSSNMSLLPQVGDDTYYYGSDSLYAKNVKRQYPTSLKVFGIGNLFVTETKAIKVDSETREVKEVLINGKFQVSSTRLINPTYQEGQVISDPEEVISTVGHKYDEELMKSELIVKTSRERLEAAEEDHRKLQEFAQAFRNVTVDTLKTPGAAIMVADRPLSENEIARIAEEMRS
jgi:hypothetical protein